MRGIPPYSAFVEKSKLLDFPTMHFYVLAIAQISTYNCNVAVFPAYKCVI